MPRPAESQARSADRIEDIARAVGRLTISRHNPDRFFEERSDLEERLRREADRLRQDARLSDQKEALLTSGAPKGRK